MIEVRDLSKRYGSTAAVDGLSFDVRPGRVTGFLGPNGAGKSTTMRMILGLDAPTSGRAAVNGRAYQDIRRPAHELGALLDPTEIYGGRRAYQHLQYIARSNGIARRRVSEVLELAGLAGVARRRVGGFSLGMKQRLGVAAALLGDPPVLMFDEPVNGLDPDGVRWIRELLRSLAREGRVVFVSSHLMSEMALMADHLVVIGRGKLIANASIADLTAGSSASHVRVRSPQASRLADLLAAHRADVQLAADGTLTVTGLDAPAVADLASAHGLPVHELSVHAASLEETFIELTSGSLDYQAGPQAAAAGKEAE
jgi:ABC-2 type transport system ATP-binding protein